MTAIAPMKAQDLKPLVDWAAPDPFAGLGEYLNPAWVAEPKIDGCRAQLVLGETANRFGGMRADSFPHLRDAVVPGLAGTVLDGEFLSPPRDGDRLLGASAGLFNSGPTHARMLQRRYGPGEFHVFDVPVVCGEDVTGQTYAERRRHLEIIVEWVRAAHPGCAIFLVAQMPATSASITGVIGAGGEGVVLKRRSSRYHPGARPSCWQKVKASSTADVFVTGWRPGHGYNTGRVGSVEVAVTGADGSPVPVAHVNIPAAWREQITAADGSLCPDALGTVIEIVGHGMGPGGQVNLPIMVKVRPDKTPADCDETQLGLFTRI